MVAVLARRSSSSALEVLVAKMLVKIQVLIQELDTGQPSWSMSGKVKRQLVWKGAEAYVDLTQIVAYVQKDTNHGPMTKLLLKGSHKLVWARNWYEGSKNPRLELLSWQWFGRGKSPGALV